MGLLGDGDTREPFKERLLPGHSSPLLEREAGASGNDI